MRKVISYRFMIYILLGDRVRRDVVQPGQKLEKLAQVSLIADNGHYGSAFFDTQVIQKTIKITG